MGTAQALHPSGLWGLEEPLASPVPKPGSCVGTPHLPRPMRTPWRQEQGSDECLGRARHELGRDIAQSPALLISVLLRWCASV